MVSSPVAVTKTSDIASVSSNEFLDIQTTIECRFTLNRLRDMIRAYSQINISSNKLSNKELAKHQLKSVWSNYVVPITRSKNIIKEIFCLNHCWGNTLSHYKLWKVQFSTLLWYHITAALSLWATITVHLQAKLITILVCCYDSSG